MFFLRYGFGVSTSLVKRLFSGERLAIAKLISLVEGGGEQLAEVMEAIFPHTGGAFTIGITGSPGAGKSTLTDALIGKIRKEQKKVAVLAIDPSSAFTGGALLGDRVRMQGHATDPDVFIRSMATRGHLGGLTLATPEAIRILDAAGNDFIIVETVGVGQAEIAITDAADTTVVVLNPGWGDSIQAGKAGLLEVADIFVVNKADREGTKQTVREIEQMIHFGPAHEWTPPVRETVATQDRGVDELWAAIKGHLAFLQRDGGLEVRRRRRVSAEISQIVGERVRSMVQRGSGPLLEELTDRVQTRELDPYAAAGVLLGKLDAHDF